MKVKFTEEELDAVETAYFDNEGYLPCNVAHVPKQKEYQVLQQLWLKMADKINQKNLLTVQKRNDIINSSNEGSKEDE